MTDWQPIETAPKDGSWLLVYEPSQYAPSVHVVRWGASEWYMGDTPEKVSWVTMALGPCPDTYDADDATHWMPLPPPPTLPCEEDAR